MFNFQNCIRDVIKIYDNHSKYNDKQISITKALVHYVKSNNNFDLITDNYLNGIKKDYQKFLEENHLPLDNNDSENNDSDYEKKNWVI